MEQEPIAPVHGGLVTLGFILVFIGFLLIFLGFTLPLLSGGGVRENGRVEGGAVVIIGPFPILVATSEKAAKTLVVLAILLTLFAVALFLLLPRLLAHSLAAR